MEIYIDHQILKFEYDSKNIEVIFNAINSQLDRTGLCISHLILDDITVQDDLLNHISDNINTIQKIEVITQTLNQGIARSLRSTNEHITQTISSINELAKEFYEKPSDESWLELIDLLETLEWIIHTPTQLNSIITKDHTLSRYGAWRQFTYLVSSLEDIVPKLEEGINKEENQVAGDVLLNEVIPLFKKVKVQMDYLENYMIICI